MGVCAVVITLNEEATIERCLSSLSFADEIVVVDSHSTDLTVELARRFTDKVVLREFAGFSDQKTAALELANQEWVLFIDADEIVTDELAAAMREALVKGEFDAYRMPRLTSFLGREMRHCGWYPDYQVRLARKATVSFPPRLVHETMEVDGTVGTLKPDLIHFSYVTIDDYVRKMVPYARSAARQKFSEGRRFRASDLLFNPTLRFLKMYLLQQGFRDGLHGFVLSVLTACSSALRYAMLWEMSMREDETRSKQRDRK